MRARFSLFFLLAALWSCGGPSTAPSAPQGFEGARPSFEVPRSQGSPYIYDIQPASAKNGGILAYDSDDNLIVVINGANLWTIGGTQLPISIPSSDPHPYMTGVAYSAATHKFFVSSPDAIYASPATGGITLVGNGFMQVAALTVDPTGIPYVVDGDHVATVANGKAKPLTGRNSIPVTPSPSIVFANGFLYVSDAASDVVYKVSIVGQMATFAGRCVQYQSGCAAGNIPGTGTNTVFGAPGSLAYDAKTKAFYMPDGINNEIWRIDLNANARPIAGYGARGETFRDGFLAFLNAPTYAAFDSANQRVYFAQTSSQTNQLDVASMTTTGPTPKPQPSPALRFPTPSFPSQPGPITTAPDQTAWVVESYARRLLHVGTTGTIAEYAPPQNYYPFNAVATDPSGNAWYAGAYGLMNSTGGIVEVNPVTQAVTGFQVFDNNSTNAQVTNVTLGPDNNLWFTIPDTSGGVIGNFNPVTDAVVEYPLGKSAGIYAYSSLTTGPDGNIWYASSVNGQRAVGRITTSGQILTPLPVGATKLFKMILNKSDDLVWYVDANQHAGSISANGSIKTYQLPCRNPAPVDITAAADGTLWIAEANSQYFAHMTTSGATTLYVMPVVPNAAAARNDNTIWTTSSRNETDLLNPPAYEQVKFPHPVC